MPRLHLAACLVAGASLALFAAPLAMAQIAPAPVYTPTSLTAEPGLPRTPDGHPDLQGAVWNAPFFGMLEAIPMMLPPELVISEDKAKQAFDKMMAMFTGNPAIKKLIDADPEASALLENTSGFPLVRGQRRTRLIAQPADGKIPYTPEARKEAAAAMTAVMAMSKADNPEDRALGERCISLNGGAPISIDFSPRQFIQTADHIVIHSEYGDDARIIPFAAARGSVAPQAANGSAVAHWDGDTLVIETTGLPERSRLHFFFPAALIVSPDAKVIERFTRVSKDELLYQFTVEDPKVYTAPWLAEFSFFRETYRLYPSGCHEGNYSLPNILSGQRVADARVASGK